MFTPDEDSMPMHSMRIEMRYGTILITSHLFTCNSIGTWLIKLKKHGTPIHDHLGHRSLFFRCKLISCHSIKLTSHICLPLKDIKALVSSTVYSVPAIASRIKSTDQSMATLFYYSFVMQSMPLVCLQLFPDLSC